MKKLLFIFFLIIGIDSYGQITNRDVFDLMPGDVFEYAEFNFSGPFSWRSEIFRDSITHKVELQNPHRIEYNIIRYEQFLGSYQYPNPPIQVDTIHLLNAVYNPDSVFSIPQWNSQCLQFKDSSYTDSCGYLHLRLTGYPNDSCFEPEIGFYEYIVGIGGPFYDYRDYGFLAELTRRLTYSNKLNSLECGIPFHLNQTELEKPKEVRINPNPIDNLFNIMSDVELGQIRIFNSKGEIVFKHHTSNKTIDVNSTSWIKGVYIVLLENESQTRTIKILK